MENLPTRNNNPGDLRVAQGSFGKYNSPQEGYAALLNDLHAKQTGNTSTGLGPNSTLADFANKYAPPTENNSAQYTANLANHMGVSPDATLSSLDLGKWADAVAAAEGYNGAQGQAAPAPETAQAPAPTNGYVDPNAASAPQDTSGYGFVTPPAPQQEIAGQPTQEEQQSTGLGGLVRGAGHLLAGAEAPFLGVAAIPAQLLAKGLGKEDPFAQGIPAGIPGMHQTSDVTPLDLEKKAGDIAQVGSYFVPGAEGLGGVAGATAMGALQGGGAAMSQGENLSGVGAGAALGAGTGLALGGGSIAAGVGVRALGDTMSGQASERLLQGIKDAYGSSLNLNAAERGFETRSGHDLAQILMNNGVALGRHENGTLDASEAIPKLQQVLTPLNAKADAIVGNEMLNTKAANFIHMDNAEAQLVERIKASNMDSLEKESAVATAEKLFAATKREYGDVVSPQVAEKVKQVLQGTAFKKALTTTDALDKNVSYLASDVMRSNVEKAIGGEAGKEYRAINHQRGDLIDAITRLTKLDGTRLLKGGRLGNMAGGVVGAISGAASGFGALGALAGDYFGTRAAEYMNNPATKIAAAKLKAKAAGIVPGVIGGAGRALGKGLAATGNAIGKGARAAGLLGNVGYSNDATR